MAPNLLADPGWRAGLYQTLAEALAEPPEWLAAAGRDWPLYAQARQLAEAGLGNAASLAALTGLPAEPLDARRARYQALFGGPGRPRVWLYESAHRGGRPFGPEAAAVARLYRAAGLECADAELPDHAAIELAFLAALAAAGWLEWERRFLAEHAGRWLPQLGQALSESGDEVYAAVGRLLRDSLNAGLQPRLPAGARPRRPHLPALSAPDSCSLCGFCTRVCPTQALMIQESASATSLRLVPAACVGCGKCERICPAGLLELQPAAPAEPYVLRQSPRAACRGCGQPLVSQAELDNVAARLGQPAWLYYCSECRSQQLAAPQLAAAAA